MARGEIGVGLGEKYADLEALSQFFDAGEAIEWRACETPISEEFELLYIYGISPHIDLMINWLEKDDKREIVFLEDRMEAIGQFRGKVFDHPRIHLKFYLGEVSLDEFISEVTQAFPYEKIEVICLHTNTERFEEVKTLLYRKATLESAIHTEMMYAHRLAKNLLRNFKRLSDAFDVGLWKDRFKGVPAVICGAGPSLQMVGEKLKELESKALIFAGGSAITALTAKGIKPHILCAIDPNPEEFTRLAFHTAYDVPLIFGCRLEPDVFYTHVGPIGYLSTGTGGLLEEWMEQELGIKDYEILKGLSEEALSVTAIAVMTAIYFGCNPIILAGVDLSYDEGKRYVKGVISDLHCALEESPGKAGEALLKEDYLETITKWKMERDVLDSVAELYLDRKFVKASPKGLLFKHIPYDPNWYAKLIVERDLRKEVEMLAEQTVLGIDEKDVTEAIGLFFASMKRCKEIVSALDLEEHSGKKLVLEMDLEEEIAFKVALKPAVYALSFQERCQLQKIEKKVYTRLQAIIDEYLQLC